MISLIKALKRPEYVYNPKQFVLRTFRYLKNSSNGEEVNTIFGQDFLYSTKDDIGRAIYSFGLYDLCVSEALWRLSHAGDTVLDIGANIGYFSSLLSKRVGPSGQVHSFEPNPQIIGALERNTRARKNVNIHPVALSEKKGEQILFGPGDYKENRGLASLSSESGTPIAEVPLVKLDDLKIPARIIKMDVEGHELSVLKGSVGTLQTVDHIVFEDHDLENNGVKRLLMEHGFAIYYLAKAFNGLQIQNIDSPYSVNPNEPPNFLATRFSPQKIKGVFTRQGWDVLRELRRPTN